jgi:hypothetical protein
MVIIVLSFRFLMLQNIFKSHSGEKKPSMAEMDWFRVSQTSVPLKENSGLHCVRNVEKKFCSCHNVHQVGNILFVKMLCFLPWVLYS